MLLTNLLTCRLTPKVVKNQLHVFFTTKTSLNLPTLSKTDLTCTNGRSVQVVKGTLETKHSQKKIGYRKKKENIKLTSFSKVF